MTKKDTPLPIEVVDRIAKIIVPYYSQTRDVTDLLSIIIGSSRKRRALNVLEAFDTQIETMRPDEIEKLQGELQSDAGQEAVAEYIDAAINTPSKIAHTAIALIMANDPEYNFNVYQKEQFIRGIERITDRQIDIYIKLCNQKPSNSEDVYNIYTIDHNNYESANINIDIDALYFHIQNFINRGLLLRNPKADDSGGMFGPEIVGSDDSVSWTIVYGISDTLGRFSRLLDKARLLVSMGPSEA